jgi:hypothetical protein
MNGQRLIPHKPPHHLDKCCKCHRLVDSDKLQCCQECHYLKCDCGGCWCTMPPEFQAIYPKHTLEACRRCRYRLANLHA